MKCPHCEKEIPGLPCQQCDEVNPEEADYCMKCGSPLEQDSGDIIEDDNGFDSEDRVLCPDGTCTGIMINGKCTECGKVLGDKKKPNKE